MTEAKYTLDNADPETVELHSTLAGLYDRRTVSWLERLGVGEGWDCLEVGGGGGSIAAWLAERVGRTGSVLVTDIDPRHLQGLRSLGDNIQVQVHDVAADVLPDGAFDLAHERLVLNHVPARREAAAKMAAAVKPGGWLLLEGFDARLVPQSTPLDGPAKELFQKLMDAMTSLFVSRGNKPDWGQEIYGVLKGLGLEDIEVTGEIQVWPGGSLGIGLVLNNFEQLAEQLLASGGITQEELDELYDLLRREDTVLYSSIMFTGAGRRPS